MIKLKIDGPLIGRISGKSKKSVIFEFVIFCIFLYAIPDKNKAIF